MYIALKTPTLQVAANLDSESLHGAPRDMELHKQPGQCLHRGDNAKTTPLHEPKGLGFPLLLGRGRMEGPKKCLQEGNNAHRHRRRHATTLGFPQPYHPPHNPPGSITKPTAKHTTKEKPTLGGDDLHKLHPDSPERCLPFNHSAGRQAPRARRCNKRPAEQATKATPARHTGASQRRCCGPHQTQSGPNRPQIWPKDPDRALKHSTTTGGTVPNCTTALATPHHAGAALPDERPGEGPYRAPAVAARATARPLQGLTCATTTEATPSAADCRRAA
jgi:hypothetical protein